MLLQSLTLALNSNLIQQCLYSDLYLDSKAQIISKQGEALPRKCSQNMKLGRKRVSPHIWKSSFHKTSSGAPFLVGGRRGRMLEEERMQYLEMFPRQNALSASCNASLLKTFALCVIFLQSSQNYVLKGASKMD